MRRGKKKFKNYYDLVKDWCDSADVMRTLLNKNTPTYLWAEKRSYSYIYYNEVRIEFLKNGFKLMVGLTGLNAREIKQSTKILDDYCVEIKPDGGPFFDDYFYSVELIDYGRIAMVQQLLELRI